MNNVDRSNNDINKTDECGSNCSCLDDEYVMNNKYGSDCSCEYCQEREESKEIEKERERYRIDPSIYVCRYGSKRNKS